MNARRSRRRSKVVPMLVGVLVVVIVAAGAVYWFAVRDDTKNSDNPGTSTPNSSSFTVSGVPFTFDYPSTFARGQASAGFIWIAGISPVDILDVRRVDNREFSEQGLKTVMRTKLQAQKSITVSGNGTQQANGLGVVRFTVESGKAPRLTSDLYFFSTGGATWQLECQSQAQNRAAIQSACDQALQTLSVS